MSLSNYLENKVIEWLRGTTMGTAPTQLWCSLHTGDPGETGASEHGATAAYARAQIDLTASPSPVSNDADVIFAEATSNYSNPITHVGIWDAATTGNFIAGGALAASRSITAGTTPRFPTGDLDFTLD